MGRETSVALAWPFLVVCGAVAQGCPGVRECLLDVEEPCRESLEVTVLEVVDGDTIDVDPAVELPDGTTGRFRLLCIDTPETYGGSECYGAEASERLRELVEGEIVTLHFDRDCWDIYDRGLAYPELDGELLNVELARQGYALPIEEYFADYACCAEVQAAADEAAQAGAGGWGACSW